MSSLKRLISLGLCAALTVGFCATAQAETPAERRARQRAERAQQQAQRRAQQEAARRERQARPDASPRDLDRSEQGFTLRTTHGWIEHEQEGATAPLTLIYINLPAGQRDAGSFRVYIIDQPAPQPLAQIAEAWKQRTNLDGYKPTAEPEPIEIDGLEGLVLEAEGHAEDLDRAERAVFVQRGSQTYVFHTSTPINVRDRVMQAARAMERSIKWVGDPKPFPEPKAEAPAAVAEVQASDVQTNEEPTPAAPEADASTAERTAPADAVTEVAQEAPAAADNARSSLPDTVKEKVAAATKDLASFDDNQIGVRFKYPSAWPESPAQDATVLMQLAPESFDRDVQAFVTFGVLDKGPLTQNLQRFVPMTAVMTANGGQKTHAGEQAIGGKPGYVAIYKGEGVQSFVAAAEHRLQIYVFVYAAPDRSFEAWLPAMKAMVESVEWID